MNKSQYTELAILFDIHHMNKPSPFNPKYLPEYSEIAKRVTEKLERDGYYDSHTREQCAVERKRLIEEALQLAVDSVQRVEVISMITRRKGELVAVRRILAKNLVTVMKRELDITYTHAKRLRDDLRDGTSVKATLHSGEEIVFKNNFKVVTLEPDYMERVDECIDSFLDSREYDIGMETLKVSKKYPPLIFITKLYLQGNTPKQVAEHWMEAMCEYQLRISEE